LNASLHVNGHIHMRAPQVGAGILQKDNGHKSKAITAKYFLFNILKMLQVKWTALDWDSSCQRE